MAPIAFISHASEDKDRFVLGFATKLRENGVDAWVDQWEMNPGDKLIDKIFNHGIANAKAFIIVISNTSIKKPWVLEELDAALIKRIEGSAKVVPVVIEDCEVPLVLKSTIWVPIKNLDNYDKEFHRILAAIFDHYEKPPIGPAPNYVAASSTTVGDLSSTESLVFKIIFDTMFENNRSRLQTSEIEKRLEELDITPNVVQECFSILVSDKLIEATRLANRYVFSIKPTTKGFEIYAHAYMPAYKDMRMNIASILINNGRGASHEIAKELGISPMATRYIMEEFAEKELLSLTRLASGVAIAVGISPALKRVAEGRA